MKAILRAALLILSMLIFCKGLEARFSALASQDGRQEQVGQGKDDDLRGLWNDRFRKQRPAKTQGREKPPSGTPAVKKNSKVPKEPSVSYRPGPYSPRPLPAEYGSKRPRTTTAVPSKDTVERVLGITIWRLRRSVEEDDQRTLIQEEAGQGKLAWMPVRVETQTPLSEGEKVRISIESPTEGYLYVIDREQYANGFLGDPMLIFPTTRTRGGDNHVSAGRVIEIPAQEDNPPYLTVRPSRVRSDQLGELLTIIVTEQPLDLEIGRYPLRLAPEQVLEWEYQWQSLTRRIEQVGSAGKPWTQAEQEAQRNPSRQLVQDEAMPQTIYSVKVRRGNPLLVSVSLPFSNSKMGK